MILWPLISPSALYPLLSNGHRHAPNRLPAPRPRPPPPPPPRPPPRQAASASPAPPNTHGAATLCAGRWRHRGLDTFRCRSRRGASAARAAGGLHAPRFQPQRLQRHHHGHRLARRAVPRPRPQQYVWVVINCLQLFSLTVDFGLLISWGSMFGCVVQGISTAFSPRQLFGPTRTGYAHLLNYLSKPTRKFQVEYCTVFYISHQYFRAPYRHSTWYLIMCLSLAVRH